MYCEKRHRSLECNNIHSKKRYILFQLISVNEIDIQLVLPIVEGQEHCMERFQFIDMFNSVNTDHNPVQRKHDFQVSS